ncbi:MAG: PqqD family protein [Clostridia bacterium]|nr:PqqD family protein [Clostridia bacterium]
MKLKDVIITEANGDYIAVTADGTFNGMIRMNRTAAFIAEELKEEKTLEQLIAAVCKKYDVAEEIAKQNILNVIKQFDSVGLIEK